MIKPISSEVLVPYHVLAHISLPRPSVPNQWAILGLLFHIATSRDNLFGSVVDITGYRKLINTSAHTKINKDVDNLFLKNVLKVDFQ
jgi:hypothetical protein